MRASANERVALDRWLVPWRDLPTAVPMFGWLRAVRDALGMSQGDLAKRVGVSRQRVAEIEDGELAGSIQLSTLRRMAEAMECTVVYAIVPKTTLDDTIHRQAIARATRDLDRIRHTMALEDQTGGESDVNRLLTELAQKWRSSPRLWRD